MLVVQGTVSEFDPQTGAGAMLLDDGTRVEFGAAAFEASGLRLLRVGQRIHADQDDDGAMTRITLPTMQDR